MASSSLQRTLVSLLLLLSASAPVVQANRVVTFQYVDGSGTCENGEEWDLTLNDFHVDCGNANHGCTPGHSIMIYGEFEALDTFYSIVDVEIKACELQELWCTPNIVATNMNFCADLELWDTEGYQTCNEVGNYTFEASYNLPNHTWWEDFAFAGLSFNLYVSFDQDLKCHGRFVTRVYYGNEAWMAFAVGSLALVMGAYYYVQKKRQSPCGIGAINLVVEEEKAEGGADTGATSTNDKSGTTKSSLGDAPDDESVTSTAYLQMMDFSPEGLSHADRMEAVRQAHFERLRKTRDSRRGTKGVQLLA